MRRHRTTRRSFLKAMGFGAVAAGGLAVGRGLGGGPGKRQRPNVIFIFIDDMGFGDPSCFGDPKVKTPSIDRLAAKGTRFTQFYVNSPICSPSRVAVTTGQYPARHLIHSYIAARSANRRRGMTDFLSPNVLTMGDAFKAAGYATAHFGKWHMGGGRDVDDAPTPAAYGFDEHLVNFEGIGNRIDGPKHTWTQTYVDKTIRFMRAHRDRPFLIRLFPNDVHDAHRPAPGAEAKWESVTKNPFERKFFAVLAETDRQIGRVLDEVDKLGLAERTIVVFTSDNGPTDWPSYYRQGWDPPGFAGPFRGRKWSLYEGGIHMPFIVRWPGKVPAGKTDEETVFAGIDLLPTLCRLAGLPVPDRLDGEDVSAAFLGKPAQRSKPIFWEYGRREGYLKGGREDFHSPPLAIRDGDWKLLMNPDGSGVELYDLAADPKEANNVASKRAEITASLTKKLAAWRASLPELPAGYEATTTVTIGYEPGKGIVGVDGKPVKPQPRKAVKLDLAALARLSENRGAKRITRDGAAVWVFEAKDACLDVPRGKAPAVAGRAIRVRAEVTSQLPRGVVLAHGGDRTGYSLYLRDGKWAFSVCVGWKRTTIFGGPAAAKKACVVEATLGRDGAMALRVDGKPAAAGKAPGPLPADPGDSVQVGADLIKPVGEYKAGNHFCGEIRGLLLAVD